MPSSGVATIDSTTMPIANWAISSVSAPTVRARLMVTRANSPACTSSSASSAAIGFATPKMRRREIEAGRLDDQQPHESGDDQVGVCEQDQRIEQHADGHEEQAEQQSFERLEVDLDLMLVFAFAQQKPGQERAERGGEAGDAGRAGGADDQQQRDRHDQVATAGLHHEVQQRAQHELADEQDADDRRHALRQREAERCPR